jgi:hypothetical protein
MGNRRWLHRYHRAMIIGGTEWNKDVRYRTVYSFPSQNPLLRWMRRHAFAASPRYVQGGLYRAFAPIIVHWRGMLLMVVGGTLVLGYAGRMATDLTFIMLGAMVLWPVDLWAASNILLPEGRREKRLMVCIIALGTSLSLLFIVVATMGISWLLNLLLPDFAFARSALDYSVIHPTGIYVACLLTPWVIVHRLLYPRAPVVTNVGAGVLFAGLAIGCMFIHYGRALGWPWLADWIRALLIPVLISGWVLFLLILSVTSRRDFALLRGRTCG